MSSTATTHAQTERPRVRALPKLLHKIARNSERSAVEYRVLSLALGDLGYPEDVIHNPTRANTRHRWAVWNRMNTVYGQSFSAIGRVCGVDHTSVMHAMGLLPALEADPAPPAVEVQQYHRLIRACCMECGVELGEVVGTSRHVNVVKARELIVCVLRSATRLSFPAIARLMCRRGHSTAITAYQRCRARGPEWAALVESVAGLAGGAG